MSRRPLAALLLAALLLLGIGPRASAHSHALSWQNPLPDVPTTANLNAVTYGNGLYVAVGEGGTVVTSPDGLNWTQRHSGTGLPLVSVAYGNSRFVAVSSRFEGPGSNWRGNILTSSDGVVWTAMPETLGRGMFDVSFANGHFVVVGSGGAMTSADGLTWSEWYSARGEYLQAIAFGNGRYVAVSDRYVLASEDAMLWTVAADIHQGQDVIYGGGQFLAFGYWPGNGAEILASPDGITWSPTDSTGIYHGTVIRSAAYGNGISIGVGAGAGNHSGLIRSAGGEPWEGVFSGVSPHLQGVIFAGGKFVAVGRAGITIVLDETGNWTERPYHPYQPFSALTSVAYGADRFVAVAPAGIVITSPDGQAWTQRNAHIGTDLTYVRYGAGRFVALGTDGSMIASADGQTWTHVELPAGARVYRLAYAGRRFVATGGQGLILTSEDGLTWTRQTSGTTEHLGDVAYGQGRYLIPGWNGVAVTSLDGVSWSVVPLGAWQGLDRVFYLGGRFFGNNSDQMYASQDGESLRMSPAPWMWKMTGLARGNGWYLVTTGGMTPAQSSRDGIDWRSEPDETRYLRDVTFGNGHFVALGANGLILTAQAPPVGSEQLLPLPERVQIYRPTITAPPEFLDLAPTHWAFRSIGVTVNAGFLMGYPDGRFQPDQSIRRAEFLALVMRAYPQPDVRGEPFDDVAPEHWAYDLILQARGAGLVQGDQNNRFHPDTPITRAEMAVILQRVLTLPLPSDPGEFPDMTEHWAWAAESVQALTGHGLLRGFPDGTFGPGLPATRAQAAAVMTRLFYR